MAAKRVVIVEDDTSLLEVMRVILETHGLQVQTATNGTVALDLIRRSAPDGVILDVILPGMSGYEVCTTMQSDETLKHIPIMIVTGITDSLDERSDQVWTERLGVAEFLHKPFEAVNLARRVLAMVGEQGED
jgi:DNA-binding response OmpR family regulator